MAVAIVQSTGVIQNSGAAATLTFAFGTTPTNGDFLLLVASAAGLNLTTPTGWTSVQAGGYHTTQGANIYAFYKTASSETNSYALTWSGNQKSNAVGYEFSGMASGNAINGNACNSAVASTSPTAVTPGVLSCLPVCFFTVSSSTVTWSSLTSGWTADGNVQDTQNTMAYTHGPITTDTSTPIQPSYTPSAGTAQQANWLFLIAPGVSGGGGAISSSGGKRFPRGTADKFGFRRHHDDRLWVPEDRKVA
jgi:hypothetical protein